MRTGSATPELCPPPTATIPPLPGDQARPACWQEIRDELFLALSNRGLNNDAASAAAERGADAAIVEARLITLAEAKRIGRPFTGRPVEPAPTIAPLLAIESAVVDIARMGQVARALADSAAGASSGDREKAFGAIMWFVPRLCDATEALEALLYRAFDDVPTQRTKGTEGRA